MRFTARRMMIGVASLAAAGLLGWVTLRPWGWPPRAVLRGEGRILPLGFTPDGKVLATSGTQGITPWNSATGRPGACWDHSGEGLTIKGAFSPDGHTFVALHSDGAIALRDATDGGSIWRLPTAHRGAYAILFSTDGRQVRAVLGTGGSTAGEVIDIDATAGRVLARRAFAVPGPLGGSAVSPDGRLLAKAAPGTSSVTLWDLDADREQAGLLVPVIGPTISSVGFSPDGSTLGVGLSDGSIELWDLATLKVRATVRGHGDGVNSVGLQFSPRGKVLASWGAPSQRTSLLRSLFQAVGLVTRQGRERGFEVVVLDLATGKRVGLVNAAAHPCFSPDGRTLAVLDTSFAVELFDVPSQCSNGDIGIQTVSETR